MIKRYATAEEAISLLPNGETIHTFCDAPGGLVGADWDRTEIIGKIKASDKIELTGKTARALGHGLAIYNNDTKWKSEVLFVETDDAKLKEFDPEDADD